MSWKIFAILSALFAGMTAVLAKIGVKNISSNLATFIRTIVIIVFFRRDCFYSQGMEESITD